MGPSSNLMNSYLHLITNYCATLNPSYIPFWKLCDCTQRRGHFAHLQMLISQWFCLVSYNIGNGDDILGMRKGEEMEGMIVMK